MLGQGWFLDRTLGCRPRLSRCAEGHRGRRGCFLSASEIAQNLRDGKVDLGVTGQDLLHEKIPPDNAATKLLVKLGFGPADVVVAVPECWLDVATMADLDEIAKTYMSATAAGCASPPSITTSPGASLRRRA